MLRHAYLYVIIPVDSSTSPYFMDCPRKDIPSSLLKMSRMQRYNYFAGEKVPKNPNKQG